MIKKIHVFNLYITLDTHIKLTQDKTHSKMQFIFPLEYKSLRIATLHHKKNNEIQQINQM